MIPAHVSINLFISGIVANMENTTKVQKQTINQRREKKEKHKGTHLNYRKAQL